MQKVLSRPDVTLEDFETIPAVVSYIAEHHITAEVKERTEIEVKYAGYIQKEKHNADKLSRLEHIRIPEQFDYDRLTSLSFEAREKLKKIRPTTLAQAGRISGVSPADI